MAKITKIYNKIRSLKSDFDHKCSFFGARASLLFTLAPYVHKGNEEKHRRILGYLEPLFLDVLNAEPDKDRLQENISDDCPIWVLWWQGLDNAPLIVQRCVESIKKNAGKHPFHLLSKDNLDRYIQLPEFIKQKVDNGAITLTHLSDIIRMALLAKYGGFWIDSTVYVTKPITGYDIPFYSIRQYGSNPRYVDNGNGWTAYFIATCPNSIVAETIYNFFLAYWRAHDVLIDYYLVDYAITLCKLHIPKMNQWLDSIPYDSDRVNDMRLNLNSRYTQDLWDKLIENRYNKLGWRYPTFKTNSIGNQIVKR